MYDFEVKVKVKVLYELVYEENIHETDQRNGAYQRRVEKTERFAEWEKLRTFAYDIASKGKKILQVAEIHDVTQLLHKEMTAQGKD